MSSTAAEKETRELAGLTIPGPGTFSIDVTHSHVGFVVRHMKVAKVRGQFTDYAGTIVLAEDPLESSVDVAVRTASVDTREENRDNHLRSGDFFESDTHPEMSFRSTKLEHVGENELRLTGDLTIKAVTKPITLDVEFDGVVQDPYGNERIGFSAKGELDRFDYGLTWNAALEAGGLVVSRNVAIQLEVEATRAS